MTILGADQDAISRALLGSVEAFGAGPPSTWRDWNVPTSPTALDLIVERMIARRRLRSRAALASEGIQCPFWYVRRALAEALLRADDADTDRGRYRDEAPNLRALLSDIALARAALQKVARNPLIARDGADVPAGYGGEVESLVQASLALGRIEAQVKARRARGLNIQGDPRLVDIARRLAGVYRTMTAREPAKKGGRVCGLSARRIRYDRNRARGFAQGSGGSLGHTYWSLRLGSRALHEEVETINVNPSQAISEEFTQ